MADPTSLIERKFKEDVNRLDIEIKDSEALVIGGLLALNTLTGKIEFMDDDDNLLPCGIAVKQAQGDNENLTGDATEKYRVIARSGITLENVSVTGAGAITDVGSFVYATDGQTMTLTRPTTGLPIGFVKKWNATTYCDVQLFTLEGSFLQAQLGTKKKIRLGTVNSASLEGTGAADLLSWEAPYAGKITALYAYCEGFDAGLLAGAHTCNLEIGTTNLTGGVLPLGFGDADAIGDLATKIAANAITGNNTFNTGDTITLELVASGTGFTAAQDGVFAIYMDVEPIIGA
jgi:hypothetical protein